jgi:hypothetical protein
MTADIVGSSVLSALRVGPSRTSRTPAVTRATKPSTMSSAAEVV